MEVEPFRLGRRFARCADRARCGDPNQFSAAQRCPEWPEGRGRGRVASIHAHRSGFGEPQLVLHACSVPSGPPASNGAAQAFLSRWMASTDYQQEFDRQFRDGFYPARVEGRLGSTGTEFRASFVPFAAEPFFFFSYHGMDQPHYDARRVHLAAEGFCQISRQAFVDRLGTKRYQSTWVRGPACNNAPALLPECSACSAETTADQDGGSAGADAGSYEADCSTH
jgi:Bacterial tandem repeat domain 1